jgi:hypothetical protein
MMLTNSRTPLIATCLTAIAVAGCGGSPTAPSAIVETGAVVAGVVTGGSAGLAEGTSGDGSAVPAGLTVTVAGTSRSATVSASGDFEIFDVPAGNVQLQFKNATVDASASLQDVRNDQFIQIQVQVSTTSAVVVNEVRLGKVTLCHAEGNGSYHFIDVSESAEQTHRDHGDGKVGDPVPGQPFKTFDESCRPVGPEIDIEKSTNGADADAAPGPSIPVGSPVAWQYVVTNTGTLDLTGVMVTDDQSVVVDCGGQTTLAPGASMTCTATGLATVIGQYRNVGKATASFTAATGSGSVTDSDASHYLGISPLQIEKLTNGEDADDPPGPSILVDTVVLWEYVLTNIGVVPLTAVTVVDDQGEAVDCGGQTTLAPGASMTCTATGVAALGQYSNLGTATANWAADTASGSVTDSDPSHYRGISLDDLEGPKVELCHRTGNGSYHLINVSINAEPAHRAHGDAKIGEAVPGNPGRVFGTGCSVG